MTAPTQFAEIGNNSYYFSRACQLIMCFHTLIAQNKQNKPKAVDAEQADYIFMTLQFPALHKGDSVLFFGAKMMCVCGRPIKLMGRL